MSDTGTLVAVNGSELWGYVVEVAGGLRLRFEQDEWDAVGLCEGRRVPVRLPGRDDAWLFVTAVTPLPPIVWVTMAMRMRAAG